MAQNTRLSEIDIMRPIVIFLLVLMHSFVIFSPTANTWQLPIGIHEVKAYHWVQELSYSFLLESFTFISGYVYAYAVLGRNKEYSFGILSRNKFKRLIIPSLVFSLLYTPFFYGKEIVFPRFFYDLICGIGHMWYLPMLFVCFLTTWIIQKIEINELLKLVALLLLAIVSIRIPSLFRLNTITYYLFFFYLGTFLYTKKNELLNYKKLYCIFWGTYFLVIIPLILLRQDLVHYANELSGCVAIAAKFGSRFVMIGYSLLGTIALYLSCLNWAKNNATPERIKEINNYCMGIYLIQQFVLKFLYYHTDLPKLGSYFLPFVGFIIAFAISYYVVKYTCKTRIGRFLFQ